MHHKNWNILPEQVRKKVTEVMLPGEQVLWCDEIVSKAAWHEFFPSPAQTLGQRKFLLVGTIIFGLYIGYIFLGILYSWFHIVFVEGIDNGMLFLVFLVIGIIVLLLGISAFSFIGLPYLARYLARDRFYILTNRNAIVVKKFSKHVHLERKDELALLQEAPTVERVDAEGVGDIVFDFTYHYFHGTDTGLDNEMYHDEGFLSCPDAVQVAALMHDAIIRRKPEYERETMKEMQEDYQGYLRKTGRL
jgi:hypothetical protein